MRPLLLIVSLLLAACTGSEGSAPEPRGLTAAEALGDFRTLDYCSLFGSVDSTKVETRSYFDSCVAEDRDEDRWNVLGPVVPADRAETEPYDYPGDLPPGVRVRRSASDDTNGCTRYVGFSDDMLLTVLSANLEPNQSKTALCAVADEIVAGVLTVIDGKRVKYVSYEPNSFGRLDACTLLDHPEIKAVAGRGEKESRPSGHYCKIGGISLSFDVGGPPGGRATTFAGREVKVEVTRDACRIIVERPLPDRPGDAESAWLDGPGDCDDLWTVAESVIPELPQ